jgi:type VI secretion system secreted protein VgrG
MTWRSVPDIIRQKLELVGVDADAIAFRLIGGSPKPAFVVHYRESDLAFISP